MTKNIENKADVELLVRSFYAKVVKDPLLAPHFEGIDFEHHFPRMFAFWNFILLDESGFTGNVFDKHMRLEIDEQHFSRWLKYFHETVDELFTGEKAELAKQRADLLGHTFQSKLAHIRNKK